ncbi:MAG: restriction endonuclease subunit S [Planctomycetaceae bacterium]|jgi:type I restriction enzyme S subunit
MTDNMGRQPNQRSRKLPTGFKQTEVGIIPTDWQLKPLGALVSSVEYGSAAKSNAQGVTPVLRMGNLQSGKIDWNDLVYTDDAKEIAKYRLRPDDVLFNRTNTIDLVGKTAIYLGEQPAIFAGYLIRINILRELLNPRYLNYILNTEFAKKHSSKVLSVAVGQANINGQKLKTYPIPLPPTLAEQEAIASALSDADGLIESLEQLIAKKRQIKHGTMQELLTGQRRLPGFSGKWEVKQLGECGEIIMGQSPSGTTYNQKGIGTPLINGPTEFTARFPVKMQWTTAPERFCKAGDLLICVRGSSTGRTNFADDTYSIGRGVAAIRAAGRNNTEFISLQVVSAVNLILLAATGSTFPSVDAASFKKILIALPAPNEQTAIAQILSEMDAEIAALETKLAKARQVKQGMMQQLLTGRIRLV